MRRLFFAAVLACTTFAATVAVVSARAANPDHVKKLKDTRSCSGCDLREAFLDGLQAELGDLSGSDLSSASLYKANLRGADLTGAVLNDANLNGADLRDTKGADLVGAKTNEMTKCPNGANGPCQ